MTKVLKTILATCFLFTCISIPAFAANTGAYDITIKLNGEYLQSVVCPIGNKLTFEPVKLSKGYLFLGWINEADKTRVIYPGDYEMTPTGDMVWSIAYAEVPIYTITPKLKDMTRLEVVNFLLDCLGSDETMASPFSDCTSDRVGIAKKIGLISGYPDGTFKPNQVLTGQEIGILMERFIMLGGK